MTRPQLVGAEVDGIAGVRARIRADIQRLEDEARERKNAKLLEKLADQLELEADDDTDTEAGEEVDQPGDNGNG